MKKFAQEKPGILDKDTSEIDLFLPFYVYIILVCVIYNEQEVNSIETKTPECH